MSVAVPFAFVFACDGKPPSPPQGPTTPTSVRAQPSAPASATDGAPSASASSAAAIPAPPPPACIVQSARWPDGAAPADVPKVGSDFGALGAAGAPGGIARVPAGATLAIEVVRTGHVITLTGPAAFRACTPDEPDSVVIALGTVSVAPAAGTKPDAPVAFGAPGAGLPGAAEIAIATPGAVAFAAGWPFSMTVGATTVADVPVKGGEVHFGTSENGEKHFLGRYTFKRDESSGLVLSRCVVQAASDSATERLQRRIAAEGAAPLPSASVAALGVEAVKHHRLAQTDCGVAQARTLLCDVALADGLKEGADGCQGNLASAHAEIVKARRPVELPPGTPFPVGKK